MIAEALEMVRTPGSWRFLVAQMRTHHTRADDEVNGVFARSYLLYWSTLSPREALRQMYGIDSLGGGAAS